MPLHKAANAARALIERGEKERQERGISATILRDQVLPKNLGPKGNTGQGFTPDPDAVTRVSVRKNSTGSVLSRRRLNLIEGTDVSITVADDSGSEEVDITIAVTGSPGTPTIFTSAYASPPGSPTDGDTWIPSDSPYTAYRVSSAWIWRYKGGAVTLPDAASLSWVNQGAAVLTVNGGALNLFAPANATSNLRLRTKVTPAATFKLRVGLARGHWNVNFAHAGIVVRDSGTGKLVTLGLSQGGGVFVQEYSGPTTGFVATIFDPPLAGFVPDYLEIEETITDRIFRVGRLGFTMMTIFSHAVATYLTTNQAGFYVDSNNATYDAFLDVFDFQLS